MDKDTIKTVDEWIMEIVDELEKKWLSEVGEVLRWHEVGVFVNDAPEAEITQGRIEADELLEGRPWVKVENPQLNPKAFSWLRECGLTDTEDEFLARLDAYDEQFKGGAYSISDGTIDWDSIEDDYDERLANKPARIVRDLTWTPDYHGFSDYEDIGGIYLELVEER